MGLSVYVYIMCLNSLHNKDVMLADPLVSGKEHHQPLLEEDVFHDMKPDKQRQSQVIITQIEFILLDLQVYT